MERRGSKEPRLSITSVEPALWFTGQGFRRIRDVNHSLFLYLKITLDRRCGNS